MRIEVIPTPFFAANCYVIAPDDDRQALVVDPSHGVIEQICEALERFGVKLGAVLCTHGHPDHVWDAQAVSTLDGYLAAESECAPVWIPGPDMYRMDDPLKYISMRPDNMVLEWTKPSDLRAFPADSFEVVPGVWIRMLPAPGHTEGSALFIAHSSLYVTRAGEALASSELPVPWALTGDVLFAGSVGRTDLPGGDETQMRHTLRTIANVVDPSTLLFPGHGPATSMGKELTENPYILRARQVG